MHITTTQQANNRKRQSHTRLLAVEFKKKTTIRWCTRCGSWTVINSNCFSIYHRNGEKRERNNNDIKYGKKWHTLISFIIRTLNNIVSVTKIDFTFSFFFVCFKRFYLFLSIVSRFLKTVILHFMNTCDWFISHLSLVYWDHLFVCCFFFFSIFNDIATVSINNFHETSAINN